MITVTHPEDLASRGSDGELSSRRAEEGKGEGGEEAEHVVVSKLNSVCTLMGSWGSRTKAVGVSQGGR